MSTGRAATIVIYLHHLVGQRIAPVLKNMGVTLAFWNLAMRPGKPMLFGFFGNHRVFGLPGNPVSSLLTARIFLCPLIEALLGRPLRTVRTLTATLTAPLDANGPRQHYMRAIFETLPTGSLCVVPVDNQDSSLLSRLAASSCLIIRPPNAPAIPIGSTVSIEPIDF